MKSERYGDKGPRKARRDRYWSVMLVGDHGRIIPFRHFKGLLISGVCLLAISIVALVILGALYARQKHVLAQLQSEVSAAKGQIAELRDEKDLYLTQLIVKQEQQAGPRKKKTIPANSDKAPPAPEAKAAERPAAVAPAVKPAASKPKTVPVKWGADIRRFKVTYQPSPKVLVAEFRIYNTSKPKKPLSGRTVVVFKNLDDTPIHWFSVPRVQLSGGEPSGSRGQSFKINNYRTEKFRAYGQTSPVKFNSATVYVYSKAGQLLVSKDFGFKIDHQPSAKPNKPAPAPVVKKEQPGPEAKEEQPAPSDKTPAVKGTREAPIQPPTTADPASDTTEILKETLPPAALPHAAPGNKPSDNTTASPVAEPPGAEIKPPADPPPGIETPTNSEPSADAPETDLKPKTQGEQQ